MTVTQPWWAIPLFTLIGTITGILLTQGGNLLNEHLKRKAERSARWDRDKAATYLEYQRACLELLRVRVWPAEPAVAPAAVEPLLTGVFRRNEELTALAHRRVSLAANEVAAAAHRLARMIEEIRETTSRGTGGAIRDDVETRYATARSELAGALERFAVTWRRDLGITAPYTAGLDAGASAILRVGEAG